jgi:hypothetical protein
MEPEVYNGTEDQDGCPDEGSVIFDDNSLIILDKIYFETNSAQILSRSFAILDAVAATLIGNPQIRSSRCRVTPTSAATTPTTCSSRRTAPTQCSRRWSTEAASSASA